MLQADGDIDVDAIPAAGAPSNAAAANGVTESGPLGIRVDAFERETIRAELERNRHNMTATARALGLERSHFYKKCAQLGIEIH